MTTLLMSSKHSEDSQALWRAAIRRGWSVERARGLKVPVINEVEELIFYAEALFAPSIAKSCGYQLLDPPEDWLVRLPDSLTHRQIRLSQLSEARNLKQPAFIKPPNDKSFPAKVYDKGGELSNAFDDDMAVLIATPVVWDLEFRCFCLDGKVRTHSPYVRNGELAKLSDFEMTKDESVNAIDFAESVLVNHNLGLPRAIVIDVGIIRDKGWSVVEANGAWGAGIYGCDPDSVLEVIRHAQVRL
ncbi:MAG: ATP-grasp domain-containing protein [Planctomycetota bacterium]